VPPPCPRHPGGPERRIILDLCGGTGAWSVPYFQAGYDVRLITLPEFDVREYMPPLNVHGILMAPPCDHFSVSGAQYWKAKDLDGRTEEAVSIVRHCLRILRISTPCWWVLENPVGRLKVLVPELLPYRVGFVQPYQYGDPYTKKTELFGQFTLPLTRNAVEPIRTCSQGSWVQRLGGKSENTKRLRSITPPGFAQAFYEANP